VFLALALFLVALSLLVFVHELGHLLAAKWAGMEVRKFSVGFGPRLVGVRIGETDYQLALVPLGGYVKIPGMSLAAEARAARPRSFASRPAYQRIVVLVAGVAMNALLGAVIYTGLAVVDGVRDPAPAEVRSPAASRMSATTARWREAAARGAVVEVEGHRVTSFEALGAGLLGVTDGDAALLFEDGSRAVLPVPRDPEARVELVSLLMPDEVPSRPVEGMGEAAAAGVRQVASTTRLAARSTELVASGALTVRQISGPVGLAALAERMLQMGWSSFLAYVAFLSVSLGFMNILPIPTLDGGHVVFVLLERLLGRPLPSRAVRLASVAGGTLVVGIMLIALTSDVMRLLGA